MLVLRLEAEPCSDVLQVVYECQKVKRPRWQDRRVAWLGQPHGVKVLVAIRSHRAIAQGDNEEGEYGDYRQSQEKPREPEGPPPQAVMRQLCGFCCTAWFLSAYWLIVAGRQRGVHPVDLEVHGTYKLILTLLINQFYPD